MRFVMDFSIEIERVVIVGAGDSACEEARPSKLCEKSNDVST